MSQLAPTVDDRALKSRHRQMWSLGAYEAVAADVIPSLGPALVEAAAVRAGQRVLDVAAGTGNATIPAARTGATVIGSDLAPALLEHGRMAAAAEGLAIEWQEADAESLPYADHEFDVVLSCVGVMFAPNHQASADEMARVCRPGGTIGLLSWTPAGFIGQMFATMKPYAPPPPPGAMPPPLWGTEDHVRDLFGDRLTDVRASTRKLVVDRFSRPEAFREFFKRVYGPTIAVYRHLGDDEGRAAALDADLDELARRFGLGGTSTTMAWEYLLLTGRRA